MNKSEMIAKIAQDAEISKSKADLLLKALLDAVTEALASDNGKLTLPGFGTFTKAHREARQGRNPATGAKIKIAAHDTVRFKAGKNLKQAVE